MTTFTLARHQINRLDLQVPLDGVPLADVELTDGAVLSGPALLTAGDLALRGVVAGAVVSSVGRYDWKGGSGLWETELPPKGYQSAAGVLRSNVLQDLQIAIGTAAGGPTEALSIGLPELRLGGVGSAYVRAAGPAWHMLRQLRVPWWVDAAGVTQIRERPGAPGVLTNLDVLDRRPEDRAWTIAPRDLAFAQWLPGNTINGETIVSFRLQAIPHEPFRVHLLTAGADLSHDPRSALDRVVAQQTDILRFHGIYEYRVVTVDRNAVGLAPASSLLGLPRLDNRELRPGVPGVEAVLKLGQSVSVGFENGDPALPFVRGFEPRYVGIPTEVRLDGDLVKLGTAGNFVARETDPVTGITILVTSDPMTGIVSSVLFTDANGVSVNLSPAPGTLTASPPGVSFLNAYKIGTPMQNKVRA